MKEKILSEIEEIKKIWNSFLSEIEFLSEVDLQFLHLYQKTLKKIDVKLKKIINLKSDKDKQEIKDSSIKNTQYSNNNLNKEK